MTWRFWRASGKDGAQGIGLSLAGLVLVALLPLLLFGALAAWMVVDQKQSAVAGELAGTARALGVAVDRELLNQFTAMDMLGADPSLDGADPAAFQQPAARALRAQRTWINVGLIDVGSHRIIGGAPAVAPAPLSLAPDAVDQVARSRQPLVVGAFASSQITRGPIILLMTPVIRAGVVRYVLGVAMNPKVLSEVFAEQRLAPSWTGAVIDARMLLAGRSRDPERYIGAPATPSVARQIAASAAGMFTALTQEGDRTYTVYSRSSATNWSVAIGLPAAEVERPIRRILLQLGGVAGALIAFGLILAASVGRGIMRQRRDYEAALQSSQAQLRESLHEFSDLVGRIPLGVFKYRMLKDGGFHADGFRFEFVSARWCEHCGVSAEEVYQDARAALRRFHPDDLQPFLRQYEAASAALLPFTWEGRLLAPHGVLWLHIESTPHLLPNGDVRWNGIQYDVTERKLAEQQLRIAATAFESQEGMIITDTDNVILRVNRAFTDITGYPAEEVVGRSTKVLKSGRHDAVFYAGMWDSLRQRGAWQGEVWNRRKNGEIYPEWLTITAVKGAAGEVGNYVATLSDITVRKAAEQEIRNLAFFDPLTRLPNRRLLLDRLQQALASSARSGRSGALLFIDLDNFKTLNDTLGHDIGDLLLQQVAQRLQACVRESDTIARQGGDEFVVMLKDLHGAPDDAARQAEAAGQKIRQALNEPYLLDAHPYHSTPSIGVTLFSGHEYSIDELLKRADLAMYQAKADGRNALRFFDPAMQATVMARATLEADLREGLQQQRFVLYYQCQVDDAGRMTGAEALVRWRHPRRGLIAPDDFIPLAEETGLILPLGLWVLETACAQLVEWAARPSMAHLTLSVNVSARQFHQPDFVDGVLDVLERSGAAPGKLRLELTESLLLIDMDDIIAKMARLKARGVCFSLDDFGTGYSSLSYLKRLPLDQLKIDRSFVQDILTDASDAAIARTIVALAHSLGIDVIAEGVETEAQREFLAGMDCHASQGYLFGRPMPAEQFRGPP